MSAPVKKRKKVSVKFCRFIVVVKTTLTKAYTHADLGVPNAGGKQEVTTPSSRH